MSVGLGRTRPPSQPSCRAHTDQEWGRGRNEYAGSPVLPVSWASALYYCWSLVPFTLHSKAGVVWCMPLSALDRRGAGLGEDAQPGTAPRA